MQEIIISTAVSLIKFSAPYLGLKISQPKIHPRWHNWFYYDLNGNLFLGDKTKVAEAIGLDLKVMAYFTRFINDRARKAYNNKGRFYWQTIYEDVYATLKNFHKGSGKIYYIGAPALWAFINEGNLSKNIEDVLTKIRNLFVENFEEETIFHTPLKQNKIIRRKKITKSLTQ